MMQSQHETLVRVYKSPDAYRRDAAQLARQGWAVVNTTDRAPRAGWMRCCFLGFFALVWRPKPELVVTYSRVKPSA